MIYHVQPNGYRTRAILLLKSKDEPWIFVCARKFWGHATEPHPNSRQEEPVWEKWITVTCTLAGLDAVGSLRHLRDFYDEGFQTRLWLREVCSVTPVFKKTYLVATSLKASSATNDACIELALDILAGKGVGI
jgi:hypothetical protein